MAKLVFKVNGVDISAFVEKRSVSIMNALTQRIDTARFATVGDHNLIQPEAGQKLEVFDGATKVFGGIIATVDRDLLRGDVDRIVIRTQDFRKTIQKRLVTRVFDTPTKAGDIIKTIMTDFVKDASFTTVNVQDGPDIDFISFSFEKADRAIDKISRLTGFEWFVDEDKDIHFFSPTTTPAPFVINETSLKYLDFKIKATATQLRNRIIIRGGKTVSQNFTQIFPGDTISTEFSLAYKPLEIVSIEVSINGGNFESVTLGVDNVDDDSLFEFMINPGEKLIRNGTHAILDGPPPVPGVDRMRIVYKYELPLITQVEDSGAINRIAAIEESDGIYEHIVKDEEITDLNTAKERGRAEITKFGDIQLTGNFKTFEVGFRSGQLLIVDFPSRGLNSRGLLIQTVTLKSLGNGVAEYNVKFGSFSFAIDDFLINLFEEQRKIRVRENEIINDLNIITESIELGDQTQIIDTSAPPYKWGPDAAQTRWNFGEWA